MAKDRARYATQISRLHGVGTGSVERFFSFCKYTDMDQRYSMSDNAHRPLKKVQAFGELGFVLSICTMVQPDRCQPPNGTNDRGTKCHY